VQGRGHRFFSAPAHPRGNLSCIAFWLQHQGPLKAAAASSGVASPSCAAGEEEEEEQEEEQGGGRPECVHFGTVFGSHLRGPRGAVRW